jgi:hypothetical protein
LARLVTVNATLIVLWLMASAIAPRAGAIRNESPPPLFAGFECTSALALLFAPPDSGFPLRSSAEVCQSNASLAEVIPAGWSTEALTAADVFAATDPRVNRAVAFLYRGQRPLVARGWMAREDQLVSLTLISPRPGPSLTHLHPGTLLIRTITNR